MPGQFVTIGEAQRRVGLSSPTFRDRVRRGEIVVFSNPRDRRSRLVAVDDLEKLLTPRPIPAHERNDIRGQELVAS